MKVWRSNGKTRLADCRSLPVEALSILSLFSAWQVSAGLQNPAEQVLANPLCAVESTEPPVFILVILGVLAVVWFLLIKMLCHRLERHHPEKYTAMGRPTLVLRASIASTAALMWFLLARQHRLLNDRWLSRLSDGMLCWLGAMLLSMGFIALFLR